MGLWEGPWSKSDQVAIPGIPGAPTSRGGALIYCYRPQRSWGKVMFLHVCVCDSVHREGSASVHAGIHPSRSRTPPQEETRKTHPPGRNQEDTPPEPCMLGDTGNKRAVRILLECILVRTNFPENCMKMTKIRRRQECVYVDPLLWPVYRVSAATEKNLRKQ